MTLSWRIRHFTQGWVVRACVVIAAFFTIRTSLEWSLRLPLTPTTTSTHHLQDVLLPDAPRIIRLSMLYGASNDLYKRALDTHERHAARWGHRFQVLREDLTSGFWNKPAYMLYSVIQELVKPSDNRAEWLM